MKKDIIYKHIMRYEDVLENAEKEMARVEQYGNKVIRERIIAGYLTDYTNPDPGYDGMVLLKFHDLIYEKTLNLKIRKDLLEAGLKKHGKNEIVGLIISDIIDATGKKNKNAVWIIFDLPEESDKIVEKIKEEIRKIKTKEKG